MIPVIKWTFWQRRLSTFWWSFGSFALIGFTVIFYPSFRDQAAELQKTFDQLPDAALQLFGGSADFFSPVGFMNSQIFFVTLPVLLAVLAIGLGTSLVGREEDNATLETLLASPISRSRLLAAKAAAGLLILGVVSLVCLVTVVATAAIVNLEVPLGNLALATLACFLLSLASGAIAFAITATGRARVASIGVSTAIAFGGYVISSLAGTVDWLGGPAKVFPFHYYQSEAILRQTYDWWNVVFFLTVTLAGGLLAWLSFRRRDLG